jgi:alanine-synthesizing transaminase
MKSYLDYGMFTPIQVAAIAALEGEQTASPRSTRHVSSAPGCALRRPERRRLAREAAAGHDVCLGRRFPSPTGDGLAGVLQETAADAKVAVSPGIGFGEYGEGHVRFGLIENEHRTRQAIRNIKRMFRDDGHADR